MTEVQDKKTTTTIKRTRPVEWIFINLPFVCYIAALSLLYIANAHFSERSLRRIDKMKKEVMDYKGQYMNIRQQLMYGSTQSQLAKHLETKNIKPLAQLPKKLSLPEEQASK